MITLRPYQSDAVSDIRRAFASGIRSVLFQGATGMGKTTIFSYIASTMHEREKRALILCHREELLDQIADTLQAFNVPYGLIAAGRTFYPSYRVQVASVQTLVRRTQILPQPDLIITDEAHHVTTGSTWGKIFEAYPDAFRLGVTATPCRLSGEALGDHFQKLIVGPSVRSLIDIGALADYRLFVPSHIDVGGIHTVAGDYNKTELNELMDRPSITGDAVATFTKHAPAMRALVFCVSRKHMTHTVEAFTDAGFKTEHIDGTLERYDRARRVREFRDGKLQILVSCEIVNEGFDVPGIECGIFLRPTKSLALWKQQMGRCLRPLPGKTHALLLDHAGNALRLGLPDTEHEWTLEGTPGRIRDPRAVPVRQCKKCYAVVPITATACKWCGAVFEVKAREVAQVEGDLTELSPEALEKMRQKKKARQEVGMATSFEALLKIEKARGYKPGWAHHVWAAKKSKRMASGPHSKGNNPNNWDRPRLESNAELERLVSRK